MSLFSFFSKKHKIPGNLPKRALIELDEGTIELKLHADKTPVTVYNFAELAKKGYYNGTIFHRVIANFMIQGGDPSGTGKNGKSIFGKTFKDEFHSELKHDKAGILSMANRGKDTNGSQFFITLAPTPHLDAKHTIFGEVVSGFEHIKQIAKAEVNSINHKPVTDIFIKKITVLDV